MYGHPVRKHTNTQEADSEGRGGRARGFQSIGERGRKEKKRGRSSLEAEERYEVGMRKDGWKEYGSHVKGEIKGGGGAIIKAIISLDVFCLC